MALRLRDSNCYERRWNLTVKIWIVHSAGSSTFHPKMYAFRNDSNAEVVIGSGNLTAGGLYTNFEGSLTASLDLGKEADRVFLEDLDKLIAEWRNPSTNAAKALDDDLMKALTDSGYIAPESSFVAVPETVEGSGRSPKPKGPKAAPIFGAVSIPNPPPSTKAISTPSKKVGPTGAKKKAAAKKVTPGTPTVLVLDGFVMTLQQTDVGVGQTTTGTSRRSPEIFVPDIGARLCNTVLGLAEQVY